MVGNATGCQDGGRRCDCVNATSDVGGATNRLSVLVSGEIDTATDDRRKQEPSNGLAGRRRYPLRETACSRRNHPKQMQRKQLWAGMNRMDGMRSVTPIVVPRVASSFSVVPYWLGLIPEPRKFLSYPAHPAHPVCCYSCCNCALGRAPCLSTPSVPTPRYPNQLPHPVTSCFLPTAFVSAPTPRKRSRPPILLSARVSTASTPSSILSAQPSTVSL